jgi:hypothetical protein
MLAFGASWGFLGLPRYSGVALRGAALRGCALRGAALRAVSRCAGTLRAVARGLEALALPAAGTASVPFGQAASLLATTRLAGASSGCAAAAGALLARDAFAAFAAPGDFAAVAPDFATPCVLVADFAATDGRDLAEARAFVARRGAGSGSVAATASGEAATGGSATAACARGDSGANSATAAASAGSCASASADTCGSGRGGGSGSGRWRTSITGRLTPVVDHPSSTTGSGLSSGGAEYMLHGSTGTSASEAP